jgi:hypothetical protein
MLHRETMAGCWNIAQLWAEHRGLTVANEPVIRRYSAWGPDSVTQLQIILLHCAVSGIAFYEYFFRSQALKLTAFRRIYPAVCLSICQYARG